MNDCSTWKRCRNTKKPDRRQRVGLEPWRKDVHYVYTAPLGDGIKKKNAVDCVDLENRGTSVKNRDRVVSPANSSVGVLTSAPQNVTVSGGRAFKKEMKFT